MEGTPKIKSVIIGGGKAARAILELVSSKKLTVFDLEILCVVDPNPNAPGTLFANEHWWPTLDSIEEALQLPDLQMVIELTGDNKVLADLYKWVPEGVRVMDHLTARIFWDVYEYDRAFVREMNAKAALQKQLEKERQQLQNILNSLPDVVMVVNMDQKIEWANEKFAKVTGTNCLEARGRKCWETFCKHPKPDDTPQTPCACRRVMTTGKPVVLHTSRYVDEFDTKHYQITANPIFDENGKMVQVVETSRDITHLIKLQRETERSEKLFRQLIDTAQEFIWIKDMDGAYTVINQTAAMFFGKSPKEILGHYDEDFLPQDVAEVFSAGYKQVLESKTHLCFTETIRLNDNENTLLTCRFPLLDVNGDVTGICTIARDVTEEKRLEKKLLRSERLAAVGKAVGGLAHDIKNILNGFQGAEYVLDYGMEIGDMDEVRKGMRIVSRNIERVSMMVQNMLAYAKDRKPTLQRVTPHKMIEEICESMTPTLTEAGIVLECSAVEGENILLDTTLIHRVLLNLVSNAVDACNEKIYAENEQPAIRIMADWLDQDTYTIDVSDNGVGMTEKVKQHLFQQFFSTKGSRGTGFGLSVSQKLVGEMGGELDVESTYGEGTTMRIKLPSKS